MDHLDTFLNCCSKAGGTERANNQLLLIKLYSLLELILPTPSPPSSNAHPRSSSMPYWMPRRGQE